MKGMSITKCPQNILINVLRERPQNNIKAKTSVNFCSHFSSLDSQKKIRFFIALKIDKKKTRFLLVVNLQITYPEALFSIHSDKSWSKEDCTLTKPCHYTYMYTFLQSV